MPRQDSPTDQRFANPKLIIPKLYLVPQLHFPVSTMLWRALLGLAAFPNAGPIINYY